MPQELYHPIKVSLKLKKSCHKDTNDWLCHILDEPRIVTTATVEYVCTDIKTAANSFKESEVEYAIINAYYGRE